MNRIYPYLLMFTLLATAAASVYQQHRTTEALLENILNLNARVSYLERAPCRQ